MSVTIETSAYEFAHGHKPRGRGNWCFRMGSTGHSYWIEGLFSEVKKVVQRVARKEGVSSVSVGT